MSLVKQLWSRCGHCLSSNSARWSKEVLSHHSGWCLCFGVQPHPPMSGGNLPVRLRSPWSSRFRTMTATAPPALKQDRIGKVDTPWAVNMPDRDVRLLPDFSHLVSPGESRFCSKRCACMPLWTSLCLGAGGLLPGPVCSASLSIHPPNDNVKKNSTKSL